MCIIGSPMGRSPGGRILLRRDSLQCVISARLHVAFQCIISAGKIPPDMQNQISVRVILSLRFSHFRVVRLSLFSLHPFPPRSLFGRLVSPSPPPPPLLLLSPPASVFGILFPRSVVADPTFVSPCCRCSCGGCLVSFTS